MFKGAAVVMGVASCGKTSVGEELARLLAVNFIEGDRLHPKENVAKMSAGIPLTDEDRWPWLTRIGESLRGPSGSIASCSALKRAYREHIAKHAGRPVSFIFLDGSRALLQQRIDARKGHFMPPSLLESQLSTLDRPTPDERMIRFDIVDPNADIAKKVSHWLLAQE